MPMTSITIQNPFILTSTTLTQLYIQQLETWLKSNRMTASPEKSSITLITTDRNQSSLHPHVKLNNTLIPLNKFPKILGLTYDTHFTFSKHIQNITNIANRKLNIIRTLSHNNFSNKLTTLITVYKQFIRPTLNSASPAWYPATSPSNTEKLQKKQNTALRIIKGCTRTTPIQH